MDQGPGCTPTWRTNIPLGQTKLQSCCQCQRWATSIHISLVEEQWLTRFALKWGDAQSGGSTQSIRGALPRGYALMRWKGRSSSALETTAMPPQVLLRRRDDGRFSDRQRRQRHPVQHRRSATRSHRPIWNAGHRDRKIRHGDHGHAAPETMSVTRTAAVIAPITSSSAEPDKGGSTRPSAAPRHGQLHALLDVEKQSATSCGTRTLPARGSRSTAPL